MHECSVCGIGLREDPIVFNGSYLCHHHYAERLREIAKKRLEEMDEEHARECTAPATDVPKY